MAFPAEWAFEAADELLRRQHEETGAPMVCESTAVYAAVAKLLHGEVDGDARRVKASSAPQRRGGDLHAGHDRSDQVALPSGTPGLPRLSDALAGAERRDRPRSAAPRQLGIKGRYGRRVLLLDRNKFGAA